MDRNKDIVIGIPSGNILFRGDRVVETYPRCFHKIFIGNRFTNELVERIVTLYARLEEKDEEIKKLKEQLAKKKSPNARFVPCKCGCNRRHLIRWESNDKEYYYYQCMECGAKSDHDTKTITAAKRVWNETMRKGDAHE